MFGVAIVMAFMPFISHGQNMVLNPGLEQWDNATTPTDWDKYYNISQESTTVHSGTYSAAHTSDASSQKLRQDIENVVPGTEYTISYWYYDNDPSAKTRIYSYWMDASQTYLDDDADVLRPNTYSTDNAEWQHWTATLTAPVNAAYFRFEVRVYKENNNTGGKVYYDDFSFTGQASNDPEPSNYPTGFAATANGLTINLTWTDAVGAQLPSGYLILGVIDPNTITPPTDGVPVADDLDWSDGQVAVNVGYGIEQYTFSNLEPATTYVFEIFPYTNGGANIDYKTDGNPPEATATTDDILILNFEDFETGDLGTWTAYNVTGSQVWVNYEYGGNKFAKMSGYENGSHANEDWLISPALDLSEFIDAVFGFDNAYNYNGNPLKLMVSTDYDGTGNPNDFTWDDLTEDADWSDGGWQWVTNEDLDLSNYLGQVIHIAFKYTSTDDQSATWEVDNLKTSGKKAVGINEQAEANVSVYPNPVNNHLTLSTESQGNVVIIDMAGKTVFQGYVNKGMNKIDFDNFHSGIYLLHVTLNNGLQRTLKVVKE